MCGITGYFGVHSELNDASLKAMNEKIIRRGPDEDGLYSAPGVGLAMRRLSIQDIAGGRQPIWNEDKTVVIVFNGEIYNCEELREELLARGHSFSTRSDTEVIVHLYEEYGADCVHHLRGMFAFALWDASKNKALLARDRLGIKPLFYSIAGGALVFGSEMKSILASGVVSRKISPQALDAFFTYTYIPAPLAIFKDIQKLPGGHLIEIEEGKIEIRRYWDLSFAKAKNASESDWIDLWDKELRDAVQLHLIGEEEVGSFLSGGVDSGVVSGMAASILPSRLKTFTINFSNSGSLVDERQYADQVAARYGVDRYELEVRPEFRHIATSLVQAFDEPFADDSIIPSYYVCEMAGKKVKVVLSGLGGDELFAGYFRYSGFLLGQYYSFLPQWLRQRVIRPLVFALPEMKGGGDFVNHLKRFVAGDSDRASLRYCAYVSSLTVTERKSLYSEVLSNEIQYEETTRMMVEPFERCDSKSILGKALYTDMQTYLQEDILALSDRLSMWHSLEMRVPFIDHRLVELSAQLPDSYKIRNGTKKYLLKKIAERWLPKSVIYHKKQGFESPMGFWLKNELRDFADELLSEGRLRKQGLFNAKYVRDRFDEHISLKRKNNKFLFCMMMFQLWADEYSPDLSDLV